MSLTIVAPPELDLRREKRLDKRRARRVYFRPIPDTPPRQPPESENPVLAEIEEIILTPAGYKEMAEELERLRTVERRDIAERIKDSITFGELTENAEYEDAKNAQAFVEGRIEDLKHIMQFARPMEESEIPTDVVGLGSRVTVHDDLDEDWEFTMVSPIEANPNKDRISDESPVGEALLGKKVGDSVTVNAPGGKTEYRIVGIRK